MSQASLAYKRGDPYSMRSVFLVTSKGDWGHMLELVFLVSEFKWVESVIFIWKITNFPKSYFCECLITYLRSKSEF